MSDADEYAVSQILQSLKGDPSLSIDTEEPVINEHQVEELSASSIRQQPSKSLEVLFRLPRKAHSGIHTADQPKAKRQKVYGKTKKEYSGNTEKTDKEYSGNTEKQDSVKTKKEVSLVAKKEVSFKIKKEVSPKKKKEACSSSNLKKFKSLRLRNPPKPFYSAIKCLSNAQKKKVIDMGFGSLLEFNCAGVPSKLGHFVADKFDAKSMKLKLENGDIQITPRLIQHVLGIPCGGTPVSSLAAKDTKKECYVNWRSQFVKELRPTDIVIKIEETEDDGIVFVLNFIILFLNTMVECVPSGRCKVDVLERFDEDVDVKSVDWSRYIYDCLKKCRFGWKRDDIGSYFTGPLTVLILIYLDLTSFKNMKTPINGQAIKFWSVEMMKKREILEMESGGFGCCEIKNIKGFQEESELEVIKLLKDIDSSKTKKEDSVKTKKEVSLKKKKEVCSSSNLKKFKSLRLRNPPKPFYSAIKCLSSAQKKKVIDMGFGSLLEFSCDGVPSKLGHFVADKFDPKSMKLKLENGDIQITPVLIQHILGIPCGGTPVSSLAVKDTKKECYVKWRLQFLKELRPSDIVRKIEETEDDGIVFVLNFLILFFNTMVECVPSGKCNVDVLERFDEDVDLKSVDWSGYVYDCLKKCKFGWKRDDAGSFFTGPLTILILIYLDLTSFKRLETPINVRAIKFWSAEMMKKREILEMESGGFGRCEIKNLSENRGVQEESELEVLIKDIDSNLASILDVKMESELLFMRGFQKFPDQQLLKEKKAVFDSILANSDSKK